MVIAQPYGRAVIEQTLSGVLRGREHLLRAIHFLGDQGPRLGQRSVDLQHISEAGASYAWKLVVVKGLKVPMSS